MVEQHSCNLFAAAELGHFHFFVGAATPRKEPAAITCSLWSGLPDHTIVLVISQ